VLIPRRHVTSIAALTDAEAAVLGPWQVRVSRALQQVMGCEKTYVAQFAEAAGFAHVHFHIVPRPPGLTRDLRGPGIFGLLGAADGEQVTDDRMDEIARGLTAELGT
jgi:diadenosine tetraphosphate (Ap4A) HIT family hydrolase